MNETDAARGMSTLNRTDLFQHTDWEWNGEDKYTPSSRLEFVWWGIFKVSDVSVIL